jgi:ATP-dependent Clp protease ATP-binding subunit ClpA
MFERFTDRARRVTVLSRQEARRLGHDHIGTEHILLAVLREGSGTGARVLEVMEISPDLIRERVEDMAGPGDGTPPGHIPFTPQAKKVLELSLRESLQLGHHYIGTEHILLGLIREGQGVAALALAGLGVDLDQARLHVTQLLRDHQRSGTARAPRTPARAGSAVGGRRARRLLTEVSGRLDAMEARLADLERRVGIGPDLGLLEARIAEIRRAKEAAIDGQNFDDAALLRDSEKELLTEKIRQQAEWRSRHAGLLSLSEEVSRLRELLRVHGIDPPDGAA